MTPRVNLPRYWIVLLSCGSVISFESCGREPIAAPVARAVGSVANLAKSSGAVAVSSTTPPFGDQGTTIDVHVFGSGFSAGAKATWLLNGVADDHVHTNSTTLVSSTELVANVTIAADATLAFWDVQVSLSNGKNGVGSDLFEVTTAEILGPGTLGGDATVRKMNDQLQVIGASAGTGSAWIYDDASGMVSLGSGGAGGLDPLGSIVVGANGNAYPTAWVRQTANIWLAEQLPLEIGAVSGNALGAARLSDGTLIAVGLEKWPAAHNHGKNPSTAIAWLLANGAWSGPQPYAMPAGATFAEAVDANALGEVVGQLDAPAPGIVWENPTTYVLLDGFAARINSTGTLIVGQRNLHPVYWYRDPVTHVWNPTGVPLPTIAGPSCLDGWGRDVNDAGVIVGWSCNEKGNNQATVWLLDLSGSVPVVKGLTALPGLGVRTPGYADISVGVSVTNASPYVVSGRALLSGTVHAAVRWQLR